MPAGVAGHHRADPAEILEHRPPGTRSTRRPTWLFPVSRSSRVAPNLRGQRSYRTPGAPSHRYNADKPDQPRPVTAHRSPWNCVVPVCSVIASCLPPPPSSQNSHRKRFLIKRHRKIAAEDPPRRSRRPRCPGGVQLTPCRIFTSPRPPSIEHAHSNRETSAVSEAMERAHETIEEHAHHSDPWARGVAVLVSVLAAVLAMTEIGGKAAQNRLSDASRHAVERLGVLPGQRTSAPSPDRLRPRCSPACPTPRTPAIQVRIKEAQDYIARMRDDPEGGEGMKQLAVAARHRRQSATKPHTVTTTMNTPSARWKSPSSWHPSRSLRESAV